MLQHIATTGHIMAGDTPVARFDGRRVAPILKDRVPLCFRHGGDLVDWLERRAIDRHRANGRVLKRILQLGDTSDLNTALRVHGAMITDNYWVRMDGEDASWDRIVFSQDCFADVALRCNIDDFTRPFSRQQLNAPTPELTNIGSFEKCWRLVDGAWTMLKAGTPEERFSEIFIYRLCDNMGLSAAQYYDMDGYVDTPDFTDQKLNFEPMRYLVQDDEDYERNYRVLKSFDKGLERQYLDILFMDALVLNPDRHTENYGILRDRKTGEILRMAPNFDNNLALISRGYGQDEKPPTNPMIRFFHDLLESQDVKYQYPPLPDEHELRSIIKGAANGLDIKQEYVFRMIQENYRNLTGFGLEKEKPRRRIPDSTTPAPGQRPFELADATNKLLDVAKNVQDVFDDEQLQSVAPCFSYGATDCTPRPSNGDNIR